MSDTILGGDFTVYYGAENRQKRIVWSGSATATRTVNELYSALQNLFDELNQMDDGVPMSAQTPTEYTIGIIDTGDKDPWFIDRQTVEHLTGGALKTASWTRNDDGQGGADNVGILKLAVPSASNTIVVGDIGNDIVASAGATSVGTLLDIQDNSSGNDILWIRPDSTAAANSFAASCTLTCNAHTATFTYDVTPPVVTWETGDSLWANIYSLGTIETYTHVYVYQNGAYLNAYKGTSDWWTDKTTGASTDHIDILVNVKECSTEIDEGYITVLARQYSKTYSYYIVDLTNGGRNPIPLQTGKDLDNQTGIRKFTLTASASNFDVGNFIYWTNTGALTWTTTTKRGVITAVSGNDITYYLIGDPITDFAANDTVIQEYTGTADGNGTGTINASAPVDAGPADLDAGTGFPTARHGTAATRLASSDGGNFDVDENGTYENYSIVIDCNQNTLANVYQWCKWITRRGETGQDAETDGMNSEYYIGSDYRIVYTGSVTGTLVDGDTVTQETSGATGTIVYINTSDKIITLRNSRGTFLSGHATNYTITGSQGGTVEMDTGSSATAITPIAAAPFGTFAGGKFFCAPGVVLDDYISTEVNNFQLVDDGGTVRVAPTKVNISVGNTLVGDRVAVFRLTGSGADIEKGRYSVVATQTPGATTLVIDTGGTSGSSTITYDEPGKTTGGVLRLVDTDANTEYRLRFTSWATSTFTLASTTGLTSNASGNTTTHIEDTGAFATAKVGDLIRRTANGAIGYITNIVSNDAVDTTTITGFTNTDGYQINTLPITTADNDTVYVPFMDLYVISAGTQTVQVVYQTGQSTIYTRVRARRSIAAGNAILPFEQDSTIGSSGMSVSVIRTPDTILA